MEILKNIPLKKYNSFGIEAKTKFFANIKSIQDLKDLIQTNEFQSEPRFILGGGSNVLFRNDYEGLIVNIDLQGLNLVEVNPEFAILNVGAGENWHNFVETSTKNKYYGIENLALIPGKVGAAPVQNIGAYGIEQKDFFHSLKGFNLETGVEIELGYDDCNFAYRNSIFKDELKDKIIITSVNYMLNRSWEANVSYRELKTELEKFAFIYQDADYVLNTIIRIRRQKLPEPSELGNAGSFFKNPIVDAETFGKIFANYPEVPAFPVENHKIKIPAAWLIEKCGWKGFRDGDAGVFEKHALVLVNYGKATGAEIYGLSERIIESVYEKFNVRLEREVIVI